jgi:hypothetical protein
MTRTTRARLWLIDHLPAGLLARPAEWFLAAACIGAGITNLASLGHARTAAALLDPIFYTAWLLCLILGGVALFCGLSSYRRTPRGWVVTRVACYRLGLRLLGLGAAVYGAALLIVAGSGAYIPAGWAFAFAGMCGVRLLTLGHPR